MKKSARWNSLKSQNTKPYTRTKNNFEISNIRTKISQSVDIKALVGNSPVYIDVNSNQKAARSQSQNLAKGNPKFIEEKTHLKCIKSNKNNKITFLYKDSSTAEKLKTLPKHSNSNTSKYGTSAKNTYPLSETGNVDISNDFENYLKFSDNLHMKNQLISDPRFINHFNQNQEYYIPYHPNTNPLFQNHGINPNLQFHQNFMNVNYMNPNPYPNPYSYRNPIQPQSQYIQYNNSYFNTVNYNNANYYNLQQKIQFPRIKDMILNLSLNTYNNEIDIFVFNNIKEIVKEAQNSILLQNKIKSLISSNSLNPYVYYFYLKPNIEILSFNKYGTYLVQILIEISNSNLLQEIFQILKSDFCNQAFSTYGSQVLQKFLDCCNSSKIAIEISAMIEKNFLDYAKNNNSIFIIFSYFKNFPPEYCKTLYQKFSENCIRIGSNQNGSCLIQKVLSINQANFYEESFVEVLLQNCVKLLTNSHGNYIIQYILQNRAKFDKYSKPIIDIVQLNFLYLSRKKHSANFIEKMIKEIPEFAKTILKIILRTNCLEAILLDQYGIYIVQKLMNVTVEPYATPLINKVKEILPKVVKSNVGPNLVKKLMLGNTPLNYSLEKMFSHESHNDSKTVDIDDCT